VSEKNNKLVNDICNEIESKIRLAIDKIEGKNHHVV
jgi:hypothetical protein